jgi:hypothetical protein
MKPTYAVLKSHHNSSEITSSSYLPAEDLYKEIGYDVNNLIKQNPGYGNTCATRMSLALIKSSYKGFPVCQAIARIRRVLSDGPCDA